MCQKNKIKTPKTIQRCVIITHSPCKHGTLRHHSLTDLLADLPVLKKEKKNSLLLSCIGLEYFRPFIALFRSLLNFPAPTKVTLQQLKQLRKSKLNLKETNNNLQHK